MKVLSDKLEYGSFPVFQSLSVLKKLIALIIYLVFCITKYAI